MPIDYISKATTPLLMSISNESTYFTILAVASLFFLAGCNLDLGERGNGNLITEREDVGDFDKVILRGNFNVLLERSNEPAVVIKTDENLMEYIKIEKNGSVLEISSSRKLRPTGNSNLTINYSGMERIEVQGAARVRTENVFTGEFLGLSMSGAGEVDMDVDVDRLVLDISGAGAVNLKGNAREQEIIMSGAGGYNGEELMSRICKVSISGVGGADVYVTEELDAQVSGIGGVRYSGNPADVRSDISGLGSVSEADEKPNM
jgi:hypothetical protein